MKKVAINKRQLSRVIVIIGVVIIPLMYSYFYLGAFWDPYSKLDDLPVALVNLDKGETINGKERNLGKEMCDELKSDASLKFVVTNQKEAKSGTKSDEYYATITIPEDFSSCISSAQSNDKQIAEISFSSNERRNYLAAQILGRAVDQMELKIRGKVDGEIVDALCEQLGSTPEQLNELVSGLNEISTGTSSLKTGTDTLLKGTGELKSGSETFSSNFSTFSKGVISASDGSKQLQNGTSDLKTGIDKLTNGASALENSTKDLDKLTSSTKLLSDNVSAFNDGLINYTNGVDALISSVENTGAFLQSYVQSNPAIMQDPTFVGFLKQLGDPKSAEGLKMLKASTETLTSASEKITNATKQLSDATTDLPKLKTGITTLKTGLLSAQSGADKLYSGATELNGGLVKLNSASILLDNASGKLFEGAKKINSGVEKLDDGAVKLDSGVSTALDKISDKLGNAQTDLTKLNGLDNYANAPVETVNTPIDAVPNYGTAFAPYFLCLSLWVGALIIFFAIYLDSDNKFKILSRNSEYKVKRCLSYFAIGLAQAFILGFVLKHFLGLGVNHVGLYYFACCLISIVFISIVQFFMVYLKDLGKFLSIALLILQLTSCGGTFPMETVPKFFNILYPFMPMTYAVGLLKQAISGSESQVITKNSVVLLVIFLVFAALTIGLAFVKKYNRKKVEVQQKIVFNV